MLQECLILENVPLSPAYGLLTLEAEGMPPAAMGQFVELMPTRRTVMLRRPFSIFRQDGSRLSILYKQVGRGTELLRACEPGSRISVLGPLGNGFPKEGGASAALVGRGVGLASFGQAPAFFPAGTRIHLIASFRTPEDGAVLLPLFSGGFEVHAVYDSDGTSSPGAVLEMCRALEAQSCCICGSNRLLRTLRVLDMPVYVSLEERMACGIGSCQGCVVDTTQGYRRVCRDGPCFSAKEIVL